MDIACDPELVKLAIGLTSLPVSLYNYIYIYICIWFVNYGLIVCLPNYNAYEKCDVLFSVSFLEEWPTFP